MDKIQEFILNIKSSYKETKLFSIQNPTSLAGSIRATLETAVKLFWLKKLDKEPVWIVNDKEGFNLHEAIKDKRFSSCFNDFLISDMHEIRKICNSILHDSAELTMGTATEISVRLEKCIQAIETELELTIISSKDKTDKVFEQVDTPSINSNEIINTHKNDSINQTTKNQETIKEEIVYARTNAEFLNKRFGTNYKQWMKSGWKYGDNTIVWMVYLDDIVRCGWKNTIVDKNTVREDFVGTEQDRLPEHDGISEPYRIIVKKGNGIFQILGLYVYDKENSINAHKHIWKKTSIYLPEAFPKKNQQGAKIMKSFTKVKLNNPLERDMNKGYGGRAQAIYDEACKVFGWDSSKRYLFGLQQILYAKEATPENYSPWFLTHNNFTQTMNGTWYNVIKSDGTIEELWRKPILANDISVYEDYTTRVTFAKTKENGYVFVGLHKAEGIPQERVVKTPIIVGGKVFKKAGDIVWVKTYKLVSDTYPISAKTETGEDSVPPTKNKYGALGGFSKN